MTQFNDQYTFVGQTIYGPNGDVGVVTGVFPLTISWKSDSVKLPPIKAQTHTSSMKTVYVVMTGEPYEGGSIVGVFSDKQKAEAYMIHAKETQDPEEVSYFWWRIKEHEVDPAQ